MIATHPTPQKKRPVRECHKCSRNGKGDEYCWKKCLGPVEDSNKGISKVSFDSLESGDEFIYANVDDTISRNSPIRDNDIAIPSQTYAQEYHPVTNQLSVDVERALVIIIANLMSLSDTQLCILRHIFHGEDLKKTGSSLPTPISKQAVFKHLLAISRDNKIVAKVIHQMMRKGHGGARRQVSQLELFE